MGRSFSGTAQFLTRGSAATAGYPCTMACWFQVASVATSQNLITLMPSGGGSTGANLDILITTGTIRAYVGSQVAATSTAVTLNAWQHAAGVFTSLTSRAAYLNGGGKGTNTVSTALPALTDTCIATRANTGSILLTGKMAFTAIWNIALSDAEIAVLALGFHPLRMHPEALVSCAPLVMGDSPEIDLVSATTWTLHGAPTVSDNPSMYPARAGHTGVINRVVLPSAVLQGAFGITSATLKGLLAGGSSVPIQAKLGITSATLKGLLAGGAGVQVQAKLGITTATLKGLIAGGATVPLKALFGIAGQIGKLAISLVNLQASMGITNAGLAVPGSVLTGGTPPVAVPVAYSMWGGGHSSGNL